MIGSITEKYHKAAEKKTDELLEWLKKKKIGIEV